MILITRPADKAYPFASYLQALDMAAVVCPVLEIMPINAINIPIKNPQAVILTSSYAAQAFMGLDIAPRALFVVGKQTLQPLSFNGPVYVSPQGYQGLLPLLKENLDGTGEEVIYLSGRDITYDFSRDVKGLPFFRFICYHANIKTTLPSDIQLYLKQKRIQGVTFFSQRSVKAFHQLALPFKPDFSKIIAYCLSEPIAHEAYRVGFKRCLISHFPTAFSLIQLIKEEYAHDPAPR